MGQKKPQIAFQVHPQLKLLYEVASDVGGLHMTRLCAAGLLLVLESPAARRIALDRLQEFENPGSPARSREEMMQHVRELTSPKAAELTEEQLDRMEAGREAVRRAVQQGHEEKTRRKRGAVG